MDTQTILALAGIVATVLFGIWAIIITVRYNRSVQITYAHDLAIALTDDITQNFPNLKVLFHNQPVSDNLVLLKGYFINTGKKDISREMIEKQITLALPSEFEWIESKVVECSPALKATAILTGKSEICIETGLWKTREYLKVEALARVPVVKADPDNMPRDYPTRRLLKALTFPHRIADSKTVRETRVPRPYQPLKAIRPLGFPIHLPTLSRAYPVMAIIFLAAGASLWLAGHFLANKALGYRMSIDGQERVMSLRVTRDRLVLKDKNGFKKEYTLSEFNNVPDKHPEFVSEIEQFPRFAGLSYISIAILMLLTSGAKSFREKRLLALIARTEKP